MLVQAYGAAFAIIVGSVVLGRAICLLCGGPQRWWAGPVVGYASLMVLAAAAIKLPGRGVTATIVCAAAVLVAAAYRLRRGRPRFPVGDLIVGAMALLGTSIPFVANGRVGVQGPPWDNDMAGHLLVAETLRSAKMATIWPIPGGYPLGPHSVVAMVGTALDLPLDMGFAGLLIATVAITAITAADVVAREALWRRVVVGVLCALTYLAASYYGEGSFKEPIVAGFVLGFVLHLEQVRERWSAASRSRRCALLIPAVLLFAGALDDFSYFGLIWFVATAVVWALAAVARRPRLAREWMSWRRLSSAAPWVGALLLLGIIILIPIYGQLETVFRLIGLSPSSTFGFAKNDLGNLPGPLSFFESLGIWSDHDFRAVTYTFHGGMGAALGIAVLAFGLLWSLRRGELVPPSAAVACGLVYWYTHETQSPYVAAKALVVAAVVFMAVGLRALLTRTENRSTEAILLAVATLFCGLAAYSTYTSLRSTPVQAPQAGRELASFEHVIRDRPVLFLGIDDFASWELRDSPVDSPASAINLSVGGIVASPTKPWNGKALDFDSIAPTDLDHFPFVITTSTSYASQAPPNFRLVARRRLYELWKRTGPTPAVQEFDPSGAPGAILNCRSTLGRSLRASRGVAAVMTTPVLAPGVSESAGQSASTSIALPAGRWELSAEYLSMFNLDFSAEGRHWTMPAYLGRNGPWFGVGEVTGRGVHSPVQVTVKAQRPSPLTGGLVTAVSVYQLAATRLPDTRRLVPLKDACGKYVDFYRTP